MGAALAPLQCCRLSETRRRRTARQAAASIARSLSDLRPAPPSQGAPSPTGRRRAVLVGINYAGTPAQLRGCVSDVKNVQSLLLHNLGWPADCIHILADDGQRTPPTRANIEDALEWLVEDAEAGDALFFHFSGHGAQQEDPRGFEEDGMNEAILPSDYKSEGLLTDDELDEFLVRCLPEGVRLTVVMDCCHSGTGLDLPFTWTPGGWREETNPCHSSGDVVLFSGCSDGSCSAEAAVLGEIGGAMTTAFCDVLRHTGPRQLACGQLLDIMNCTIAARGFRQRAQLTSSQRFRFDRPFQLDDAVPNSNPTLGRIFRRKFSPKPRWVPEWLVTVVPAPVAMVPVMPPRIQTVAIMAVHAQQHPHRHQHHNQIGRAHV